MNYYLLSDIHLELISNEHICENIIPKIINDCLQPCTLLLCGDIGSVYNDEQRIKLKDFLIKLKNHTDTVVYIPGNHEYYNGDNNVITMDMVEKHLTDICHQSNVILLIRNIFEDQKYIFYGCTLWTILDHDMSLYLNDLRKIYVSGNTILDYKQYTQCHIKDGVWLYGQIQSKSNKPKIVLTHHLPTEKLIEDKYKSQSLLNKAFYVNMESLFPFVKSWYCGHSHTRQCITVGNTHLAINAVGYKGEFDSVKVLKLDL